MSVVVTVAAVGTIAVGSKVFAAMAAVAAAQLGMKAAEAATAAVEAERREGLAQGEVAAARAAAEAVELSVATEAALEQVVAERCELTFRAPGTRGTEFELTVRRDIRGKVTVRAHGHGMSRAEVAERAERFLGLLRQQVAYRQVVQEMKRHGFSVAQEERQEDGTVRVSIRRRKG